MTWQTVPGSGQLITDGPIMAGTTFQTGSAGNNVTRMLQAMCRVHRSGVQSIADSTETIVQWDIEPVDTYAMHNPSSPGLLIAPIAGKYLVGTTLEYTASTSGERLIVIRDSGGTWVGGQRIGANPIVAGPTMLSATTLVSLAASGYLTISAYHNAGANLNIAPSTVQMNAWMIYAGE